MRTGDPRIPGTLHYQSTDDSLNDYEEVITAIGDALASFNNTKEHPVWGFGAKFGGVVRHIFQLGPSTTVNGVDGVLEAYQSVFRSDLVMSGPTSFSQVIQAAALRARKFHVSTTVMPRLCIDTFVNSFLVATFTTILLQRSKPCSRVAVIASCSSLLMEWSMTLKRRNESFMCTRTCLYRL